jgi:hypothetical protein
MFFIIYINIKSVQMRDIDDHHHDKLYLHHLPSYSNKKKM